MEKLVEFLSDSSNWLGMGTLLLAFITTFIAVRVQSIARNIRTLDWYRSQNDAWNHYNAQKLTDSSGAFEKVDVIVTGKSGLGDKCLEDYKARAVLFQRLNILERDYKAIALRLVGDADGHYLLNDIRAAGSNAQLIVEFMEKGGYDPRFVAFYRNVSAWYAANPGRTLTRIQALKVAEGQVPQWKRRALRLWVALTHPYHRLPTTAR